MDKYDQIKYANRVPNTTPISGGLNLSCPYCKEGSSEGRKKRGFILWGDQSKNYVTYYCHNCPRSTSLENLLMLHYPTIYSDFLIEKKKGYIEKLKKGEIGKKKKIFKESGQVESYIPPFINLDDRFIPAQEVEEVVEYCQKRKIPNKIVDRLFYSPPDLSIVNTKSEVILLPYRDMLIFPFYKGKKVYGFQGRSLRTKFFHTVVDAGWKIYGFFNVDRSSTVFIFESIIDSLSTDNAIASLGADINNRFLSELTDIVFCFDNDKPGKEKSLKYADDGHKIFCWPRSMSKYKDANKAMQNGFTKEEITSIIKDNIFTGFQAKVRLQL